jgi:integrase
VLDRVARLADLTPGRRAALGDALRGALQFDGDTLPEQMRQAVETTHVAVLGGPGVLDRLPAILSTPVWHLEDLYTGEPPPVLVESADVLLAAGNLQRIQVALRQPEVDEQTMYAFALVLGRASTGLVAPLRALRWCHVDLAGKPDTAPQVPPSIAVWRSVRAGGDTKTKKSRRTLAMPQRCVAALTALWDRRTCVHANRTECECLVFVSLAGTPLDAHNVRRSFRKVASAAGLTAKDWTPRELRHSFVSLLSDDGMPIEQIARLVGHTSTAVTETVYRQQIRPVIIEGAEAMDRIFNAPQEK